MCIICTGEIDDENLYTLTELNVSFCRNLTSEKLQEILDQCKNLKTLRCNDCTSLTRLDLRNNKYLKTLGCCYCTSLTRLDLRNNINLVTLVCYNCTFLTNLDLRNDKYYQYINYSKCPWISQNEYFSNNLQRLIKLQRWYRKLLLIKYMKSKQFIEWIYNPNNIGGRLYKFKLLKEFTI